jgi:two-component system nitrate/nitrite response regulator NarL
MNLLIVDDHPMVRRGLAAIISNDSNNYMVSEASNINEAIDILEKYKPEIALVDLKLGFENGIELVKLGKEVSRATKYILLTSFVSYEEFKRAEQIEFDGYILKEALAEDILYAINLVLRGKKYYDPEIINYIEASGNKGTGDNLTEREREVLNELRYGLSNDEIAKRLYISQNTVKKHVSSIMSKLNINNRTQAVMLYNNMLT